MWAWLKRFSNTPATSSDSAKDSCPTCAILLQQLDEARKREARLHRQIESKDSQIGMVIQAKFETVHLSSEHDSGEGMSPVLPLDSLLDVHTYDDEAFINQVSGVINQ